MSKAQESCSPLLWDEFQWLLKSIDDKSRLETQHEKIRTLIKYHSGIAIAGYTGLRPKEWFQFRWQDFETAHKKRIYEFKMDRSRVIKFDPHLIGIVVRNRKLYKPFNDYDFIMVGNKEKPMTIKAFNKKFAELLSLAGIDTDNPSSVTLRKTYALRVYRKFEQLVRDNPEDNRLIDPLVMTSKMLGHRSTEYTRDYIFTKSFINKVATNLH